MAKLFFSYSHADEALRDQLETQLAMLKRQGLIETWHDRRIGAGSELNPAISEHVEEDNIILLLISPDFLASEYCYDKEMLRAMARHDAGQATVIPVILRPCLWHSAPFGKLMAVPTDGKPVTTWPDRDQAFLTVAEEIRKAALKVNTKSDTVLVSPAAAFIQRASVAPVAGPRSSNLRLAKQFGEKQLDQFRVDSFDYIAKFFENSLTELETRNDGVEGTFRRVDANRFTAAIYKGGKAIARCTIFMGGMFGRTSISYVNGEATESNSFNDSVSVEADDQSMYLKGMGMSHVMRGNDVSKLSQEGAAEFFWAMLIEPLQRNQ